MSTEPEISKHHYPKWEKEAREAMTNRTMWDERLITAAIEDLAKKLGDEGYCNYKAVETIVRPWLEQLLAQPAPPAEASDVERLKQAHPLLIFKSSGGVEIDFEATLRNVRREALEQAARI